LNSLLMDTIPTANSRSGTRHPLICCFIIKEDKDILDRLRVGDRLNMKYYDTDLGCPSEYLETEIRKIKKNDRGRLRGQYLVDLEIRRVQNWRLRKKSICGVAPHISPAFAGAGLRRTSVYASFLK
jgi:hypothetical protein